MGSKSLLQWCRPCGRPYGQTSLYNLKHDSIMPHCTPCEGLERQRLFLDSILQESVSTIYIYSLNALGIYNIYIMASNLQPYVDSKLALTKQHYMRVFNYSRHGKQDFIGPMSVFCHSYTWLLLGWEPANSVSSPSYAPVIFCPREALLGSEKGSGRKKCWFMLREWCRCWHQWRQGIPEALVAAQPWKHLPKQPPFLGLQMLLSPFCSSSIPTSLSCSSSPARLL